jgi:hemolysin III
MSARCQDREVLADRLIHVVGIAAGLVGAVALLAWAAWSLPGLSMLALAIYCAGLLAMLGCSGAYHLLPASAWKPVLRRLDHAAIFLKIAATYTPFALVNLGGATGLGLLAAVWSVALLGATAKLLLPNDWDRFAIVLYLALGWSGVALIGPLVVALPRGALVLLAAGGIVYSLGVIVFVRERLPYQTAIWHAFVLVGTACHFGAVTLAAGG